MELSTVCQGLGVGAVDKGWIS